MENTQLSALIRRTADGDLGALEAIFVEMRDGIFSFTLMRTGNRSLAEDILQETILQVHDSAKNYRRFSNPRAWILTIARNLSVSALRKTSRETELSDEIEQNDGFSTESHMDGQIDAAAMISGLPPQEREIVVLHAISGLKHREIAKLLGLPLGTVCWKYNETSRSCGSWCQTSCRSKGAMGKMDEQQILAAIRNNTSLKAETVRWDDIERKLENRNSVYSKKPSFKWNYRIASTVCAVVVALVVLSSSQLRPFISGNWGDNGDPSKPSQVQPGSAQVGGGAVNFGMDLSPYYRYNGDYYWLRLEKVEPAIQNQIEKSLGGNYYAINGYDPAKTIALFTNNYYWRLDYVFPDTVTWGGKPYLIEPWAGQAKVGEYLGESDGFKLYRSPDAELDEGLVVQLSPNRYAIAYQLPSSVTFAGQSYQLQTRKQAFQESETYLGMAGPYKAYSFGGMDSTYSIMLHINDAEEVQADAIILAPVGQPLPVSLYGSVLESMYSILMDIQWTHHGFYVIGYAGYYSQKEQDSLKNLVGEELGSFAYDGHTYWLYEMKGTDPAQTILVKNNQAYMLYNYIYPDTIVFQGSQYVAGNSGGGVVGGQIGTAGKYPVFAVQGVDPAKEIVVGMSGKAPNFELQSTVRFYYEGPAPFGAEVMPK